MKVKIHGIILDETSHSAGRKENQKSKEVGISFIRRILSCLPRKHATVSITSPSLKLPTKMPHHMYPLTKVQLVPVCLISGHTLSLFQKTYFIWDWKLRLVDCLLAASLARLRLMNHANTVATASPPASNTTDRFILDNANRGGILKFRYHSTNAYKKLRSNCNTDLANSIHLCTTVS